MHDEKQRNAGKSQGDRLEDRTIAGPDHHGDGGENDEKHTFAKDILGRKQPDHRLGPVGAPHPHGLHRHQRPKGQGPLTEENRDGELADIEPDCRRQGHSDHDGHQDAMAQSGTGAVRPDGGGRGEGGQYIDPSMAPCRRQEGAADKGKIGEQEEREGRSDRLHHRHIERQNDERRHHHGLIQQGSPARLDREPRWSINIDRV
ncbi:hypothetical protein PB2503_01657 [Parvularcula bermudensis HTCC2503]|uniref:Uncharacterized protein n=1 Tax=Parvularcula bermudensis (strain ATCC BAA-594 / HTCC2503 / KCTC 12087) TaxID=314260 RepID=E0TBN5_PARBH|nr:hypothetical protein PB2503_01657 [Parvularcula bermudensis HTCC2503]